MAAVNYVQRMLVVDVGRVTTWPQPGHSKIAHCVVQLV